MADERPDPPPPVLEYENPDQPGRVDPFAVASLVFGLLFCIPAYPGLVAVGLGWIAMKETRRGSADSGLALIGFVLVAINLIWSGVVTSAMLRW